MPQSVKQRLIRALRNTYKRQYEAVHPIPYMREKHFSVDQVFIDSGFEVCVINTISRRECWKPLESYKSIFGDPQINARRLIIQGDPGYGKSTLTLQLAYDWCNRIKTSPIHNVEILIILRLRQFGSQTSIFEAIKLFLVPKIKITIEEINSILDGSSSVKIILDGYDEYNGDGTSYIDKVIEGKLHDNIDIVITTRYISKEFPEEETCVKLLGFDSDARKAYIKKAIVDDDIAINAIQEQLKDNVILTDFCEVPLIYVMFAHVAHQKHHNFRQFNSVTGIFRFLVSAFHDHMRNKLNDTNVKNFYQFENDHSILGEIALDSLCDKQFSWRKKYLLTRLSKEFYSRYIKLGILVEEKVVFDSEDSTDITQIVDVRFHHNIFCEWYAAHYLAFLASKPETKFMKRSCKQSPKKNEYPLYKLDPLDFQYVFRFACGIRPEAGDKIIDYLQTIKGCNGFAILCSLEQNRKESSDMVKKLCSETVFFKKHDTMLSKRSLVILLKIASTNKIPVKCLRLEECLATVVNGTLTIDGDLELPSLQVGNIQIKTSGNVTVEEMNGIMAYAQQSAILEELVFEHNTQTLPAVEQMSMTETHFKVRCLLNNTYYELDTGIKRWRKESSGNISQPASVENPLKRKLDNTDEEKQAKLHQTKWCILQ